MELVEECTISAILKPALAIGAGPYGNRMYYEIDHGKVVGERLNGRVVGGGEWALLGVDGYVRVDVRAQIETHDGAFLYVQYFGLLELNEAAITAMTTGGETSYGEHGFHTNPRFETGDQRYTWLNTTFFVAEGHAIAGPGVEYRLWRPV